MRLLLFAMLLASLVVAQAEVGVRVTFKDVPVEFQPLEPAIRAHVTAAVQAWAGHFKTRQSTIEVVFSVKDWPNRGTGHSVTAAPFVGEKNVDGRQVSEEGAAQKLRTGRDPNGDDPDIEMFFDPAYLRTLWFDPDPKTRTEPLPSPVAQKLDAFSIILHEIGHAIGFNGYRDPHTGVLSGEYLSAYDRWVTFDGTNFFFNGPNAMKLNGGPVPLAHTISNYHHLGEPPDANFKGDLMNGMVMEYAHRYSISPLDIAILSDCGLTPKK